MGAYRKLHWKVKKSTKTDSDYEDVFKLYWFAYNQVDKYSYIRSIRT